jgi:hypothetical protein
MLTGPKIKACFRSSFTWFIINLQRRKIFTVLNNMDIIQPRTLKCEKAWACAKMQASLHTNPMLKVNCPVSPKPSTFHKPLDPPLPHFRPLALGINSYGKIRGNRRHRHVGDLLLVENNSSTIFLCVLNIYSNICLF